MSRPISAELDPAEVEESEAAQLRRCTEFSAAFLHYCSSTGPFRNWKDLRASFESTHVSQINHTVNISDSLFHRKTTLSFSGRV